MDATSNRKKKMHVDELVDDGQACYTDQEINVATMLVQGLSDEQIATKLRISIPLVHDIKAVIIAKARASIYGC
jgi:DNA-binding NarL/FixJ family response regulator